MQTVVGVEGSQSQGGESLEKVLQHLVRTGDPVGVVRLVERWGELHPPVSREGRLAEARAWLDLRQMDRAWGRLRDATEANPEDADALVLTAEMYIERGWPARARKVLEQVQRLDPGRVNLEGLLIQAAEPPRQPPPNAKEIERHGTEEQQRELAERYLSTGSILRARTLLDALNRKSPGNRRVEHLLWGIRGEFVNRAQSMSSLLGELFPPGAVEDWEEGGHTESAGRGRDAETAEISRMEAMRAARPAFPSLFRRPDQPIDLSGGRPDDEDEVTISAVMASREELLDPPSHDATDAHVDLGGLSPLEDTGDTQILKVIPSNTGPRVQTAVDGPIHKAKEAPDPLRNTLNLRAWQKSMGVTPPGGDEHTEEVSDFPEEDGDRVVMKRNGASRDEPSSPKPVRAGPIEVIDKVPTPVPLPEDVPDPSVEMLTVEESAEALPEPDPLPAPQGPSVLRLVAVGALLLAFVLFAAVLALLLFAGWPPLSGPNP